MLVYLNSNHELKFRTLSDSSLSKELNPFNLKYFEKNGHSIIISTVDYAYNVYHPTDARKEFHPSIDFTFLYSCETHPSKAYELFDNMSDKEAGALYSKLSLSCPEIVPPQLKN